MGYFFNFILFDKKVALENRIKKATLFLKKKQYFEAKKAYEEILKLIEGKREYYQEYALVLNNLIVAKYFLQEDSKEIEHLYKKLCMVRFELLQEDSNYFGIDYLYTVLMGVEWFGYPKEKLNEAKQIASDFKETALYPEIMKKISQLQAKP